LIGDAYAMGPAPQAGAQQGGLEQMLTSFAPLIIIFAIFYFLMIRPQKKKAQEYKKMLEALKPGDKIITAGGMYGVIEKVGTHTVTVKVAPNMSIKLSKNSVSMLRTDAEEE
jgi:preprotein translocase subunit YajC